ncbi:hypothetical protein B4119_3550 [Parageobacillus caldoxylosilyticus]|jgi:hypothetical protein|uniref:Uncharacterized protein n=1 Tax=Saccharococcus caldoxylosilyticus TaxID=81408 RepID=A0A150L668_9BACL|nr:hypothetical protein B4119_3550 [Parageobacillus caldoxylosilyticus]
MITGWLFCAARLFFVRFPEEYGILFSVNYPTAKAVGFRQMFS